MDAGVFLKKQWFIKSRSGKVEDHYQFDIKKVNNLLKFFFNCIYLFYFLIYFYLFFKSFLSFSFWVLVHMVTLSKQLKKTPRQPELSRLSKKTRSETRIDSNLK